MLKLFRQIRQKLLLCGKIKSYTAYAIGEIILVVIGILMALQINNWNETQKLIRQEKQILLELKEELLNNTKSYKRLIEINKLIIDKTNTYLNDNRKRIVHKDSISKITALFSYNPYLIEQPILNTILNSSDEKIVKYKFLLEDLRALKRSYNYTAQNLNYLDSFWNTNSAKYLISSGVGSSMGYDYVYDKALIIDDELISLLIMQRTLLGDFIGSLYRTNKLSLEIIDKIEKLTIHD